MIERLFKLKRQKPRPEGIGRYHCPVCSKRLASFLPLHMNYFENMHRHGFIHNIFLTETINFSSYTCPNCQASDRDRLYALYISQWLQQQSEPVNALEIGPSGPLRQWLGQQAGIQYRCADLFRQDVDDNVDITDMTLYADNQFQLVICSHVLEHVPDDRKAMQELCRILHPEGIGIIMVPINLGMTETDEAPDCTDIAERWHRFGQDDHIRMYAKADFVNRLETAGFQVECLDQTFFGADCFEQHGIFPTSVLYIARKRP